MNRDGSHLSDLSCVTGKTPDAIALESVPSRLTKSYDMPGDMVLTEGEKLVTAEAVKNAIANPFAVARSRYTTAPANKKRKTQT